MQTSKVRPYVRYVYVIFSDNVRIRYSNPFTPLSVSNPGFTEPENPGYPGFSNPKTRVLAACKPGYACFILPYVDLIIVTKIAHVTYNQSSQKSSTLNVSLILANANNNKKAVL